MICLLPFEESDLVTPLPCDIRHYYHTSCIEQWLMINACCPLCKTEVTMEEIERVSKLYMKRLDQHAHCCSEASNHKSHQHKGSHYSSREYSSNRDSKGSPNDYENANKTKKKASHKYSSLGHATGTGKEDSFYMEGQ